MKTKIIFTCEHAHPLTPPYLAREKLFPSTLLKSHYGWDEGAKRITELLSKKAKAKHFLFPWSRLYIDANRRLNNNAIRTENREIFGKKADYLIRDYELYRQKVRQQIEQYLSSGHKVLIFSVHSFTPVIKGKKRKTEIGILFRPFIKNEWKLAHQLKKSLQKEHPKLHIHFNRPYRGYTDCFLNDLLDSYKKNAHVNGLFLEFNQNLLKQKQYQEPLITSFSKFIEDFKYKNELSTHK